MKISSKNTGCKAQKGLSKTKDAASMKAEQLALMLNPVDSYTKLDVPEIKPVSHKMMISHRSLQSQNSISHHASQPISALKNHTQSGKNFSSYSKHEVVNSNSKSVSHKSHTASIKSFNSLVRSKQMLGTGVLSNDKIISSLEDIVSVEHSSPNKIHPKLKNANPKGVGNANRKLRNQPLEKLNQSHAGPMTQPGSTAHNQVLKQFQLIDSLNAQVLSLNNDKKLMQVQLDDKDRLITDLTSQNAQLMKRI